MGLTFIIFLSCFSAMSTREIFIFKYNDITCYKEIDPAHVESQSIYIPGVTKNL